MQFQIIQKAYVVGLLYFYIMLAYNIFFRSGGVLLFGLCLLFSQCQDDDTILLSITQPVVFSINEAAVNSSGKDFEINAGIDIRNNAEVIDYLNKIEALEINLIDFTISGSSSADISLLNGIIETSSGLDVTEARQILFTNSSTGKFNLQPPGINDLSTRLKGSGHDNLKLLGRLTRTPFTCTLTVNFHLLIKARAS
ncbi:MAG: hypothetical protein KF763_08660 [Cyclobacteriaceae bacterium]|nr:hypothetical protein [Cyclobacteriaceae bacterium]